MRILILDIETSPNLAWVWGLWKQNVSIDQIAQSQTMLCWAAKWLGEEKVFYKKTGDAGFLHDLHELMSKAQAIVHYNGKRFDIPHINREFLEAGMPPPPPHKDIDLLETIKRRFRFPSNKLDYVLRALGMEVKEETGGFKLWLGCMAGDKQSWATMRLYNIGDVLRTEQLYLKVLPWLDRHPSVQIEPEEMGCPKCGSSNYHQRGWAYTTTHKYRRYQCQACNGWFRGHRTVLKPANERPVNVAA